MIKRIVAYVVIASVISAVLLFLGITLMGIFSPALASSFNALVAGAKAQTSSNAFPAKNSIPLTGDLRSGEGKPELSPNSKSASASLPGSEQSLKAPVDSINTKIPVAGVTIAQLFKNQGQFHDQVITIRGIATSLGNEKVLINDGTGQILVEIDDELVNFAVINGLTITILGKLDNFSSPSFFELDACTLSYQNQTIVIDDCEDDDGIDDINDDLDDDVDDNDDIDDDGDDDDMNDDDDDDEDDSDDDDDADDGDDD